MANLQANNAAGGSRARIVRVLRRRAPARARCRSTSPTSTAAATPATPAAYTRHERGPTPALTQDLVRTNPQPGNSAADLDGDAARRSERASAAGLPANFFVVNPARRRRQRDRQRRVQRLPRAADRSAAAALAGPRRSTRNYQYALEGGSAFLGLPLRPRDEPDRQRAARHQDAVGLDASGRPRRSASAPT